MNWKRYVLPSVLILALASAFAVAQTINRALQLSQDASGSFSVDSNNGVYFPGHVLTTGLAPLLTSCGTSPTILGTDTAGTITGGTTNLAGCVATFRRAYLATPYCMAISENPATSPIAFTMSTTALTVGGTNMGQAVVHYFCTGSR